MITFLELEQPSRNVKF